MRTRKEMEESLAALEKSKQEGAIEDLNEYGKEQRQKVGGSAFIPVAPETRFPLSQEESDEMQKDINAKKLVDAFTMNNVDFDALGSNVNKQPMISQQPEQPKQKQDVTPNQGVDKDNKDPGVVLSAYEKYKQDLKKAKEQDLKANALSAALQLLGTAGAANIQRTVGVQAGIKPVDFNYDKSQEKALISEYEREQKNLLAKQKLEQEKEAKEAELALKGLKNKQQTTGKDFKKELEKGAALWPEQRQAAITNREKMRAAVKQLEDNIESNIIPASGAIMDFTPDVRESTITAKHLIQNSAWELLKSTFPGAVSDDERKAFVDSLYSDKLSPKVNLELAKAKLRELESKFSERDRQYNYFMENNQSFEGYSPSKAKTINPKSNTLVDSKGNRYIRTDKGWKVQPKE